ncbi:MAG: hypothetical protein ABSG15_07380 [FCB group bacterium]|jgi:hypothetical protein
MHTYNAEIKNDKVNWLGKKPKEIKETKPIKVEIKIIEKEEVPKNDLVEFFRNSPLHGIELDLERVQDSGRDIEL